MYKKSPLTKHLTELSNVVAYPRRHSPSEDRQMSHLGRLTAYKPEYCELAHNYCLRRHRRGAGGFFGVTWKSMRHARD